VKKIIVSAPFGNHLQWPECTPTLGTFTREYRGGPWYRVWRVLRTVRYYYGIGAFKNKLGLPNPGIEWLRERVVDGRIDVADKIVSISARTTNDWMWLLELCQNIKPGWVELNTSCPNTNEIDNSDYRDVFATAADLFGPRTIVKLPPVNYRPIVDTALWTKVTRKAITSFHCCNTLPSPGGGISGKPLKALSLEAVRFLREHSRKHALVNLDTLIGGGGVTCEQDVQDYLDAGATNVAVGSALFFPWKWREIRKIAGSKS
jgi:dihydroorotate dehydrogenase